MNTYNLIANGFAHGEPKAQPRPRAFARGGKARVYDPGTAEGWKSSIAQAFEPHAGELYAMPVLVEITLYFPRPKGHFGTGKNADKLKPKAPAHHLKKPDADNCAKAILDALSEKSGIGLWKDDTQVIDLIVKKRWACPQIPAGASIFIHDATQTKNDQ